MKKFLVLALLLVSPITNAETTPGFHDESGAGIVVTTGNSRTQSYNLGQTNTYGWEMNLLKFEGKFLDTSSNDVLSAKKWSLGLRYEREISRIFSLFVAQAVESDIFSGYNQRYNSDLGLKYFVFQEEAFVWEIEAGGRYTIENRLSGQVHQSYSRLYTEANRKFNKATSLKLDGEYLQNLSETADHQLNGEIAVAAVLNEIFSVKTGYLVKYRSILPPPATQRLDTQLLTALVAKF